MIYKALLVNLFKQIANATAVHWDSNSEEIHLWNGSNGVNVYDFMGVEVDFYTMGKDNPTVEDFKFHAKDKSKMRHENI